MALAAREAMGKKKLQAYADRGYFSGLEIKACDEADIKAFVPKPMTSNAKAEGRFSKADFIYIKRDDEYQCPAGERAIHRFNCVEGGLMMRTYWSSACPGCAIRAQCTTSAYRRIRRWEHEAVLEQMQRRLDRKPEAMTLTTKHRRARLRNAQALDGNNALPHAKARACRHRDEPARAGLQPQASDASARHCQDDEGDEFGGRVSAFLCPLRVTHWAPVAANRHIARRSAPEAGTRGESSTLPRRRGPAPSRHVFLHHGSARARDLGSSLRE
jgi:hypothetical protein